MTEDRKWWEEAEAPPSQYESPQPYVKAKKKKTEAQLERETNGGRELPKPACPFDDVLVDPQINAMGGKYVPPALGYIEK